MINISPYKQKKQIKRLRDLRIINSLVVSIIILTIIAIILSIPTAITVNSRYELTKNQLQRLENSGEIIKEENVVKLQSKVKRMEEKFAVNTADSPLNFIDQIRRATSTGIVLMGFETTSVENIIQVRGIAQKRQNIQQFVSNLQELESVESVDSPVTNYIKSSNSEFIITITFKES